jgi:hypothetical protein
MLFLRFLRRLDLFGYPVGFHLQGRSNHKSMFGGTMSLLLCILFVLIIWKGLLDLIMRTQFTVGVDLYQ